MNQSHLWKSYHYPRLLKMWQDWATQPQWYAADRWLKDWQKRHPFKPPAPAKNSRKPSAQPPKPDHDRMVQEDRLAISQGFFHALRFLQLASALEHGYRLTTADTDQQPLTSIDWSTWDADWRPVDAVTLDAEKLWYWVGLRLDKHCPAPKGLKDASQRQAWLLANKKHFNDPERPDTWLLWHGLRPQWRPLLLERKHQSGWSDRDFVAFVCEQNNPPPLWLRIQGNQSRADIGKSLLKEGVTIAWDTPPTDYLCAAGGRGVQGTQAYKEGLIEIQDLASQQIALAVAANPGDKVWDACAGAGGKTLAIAARMQNKGVLVATDLHGYKLDELKRRAKRADLRNVRTFAWDGNAPLRLPQEVARQQGFDWVLVDAPCSGSGTWRRNPDARWRYNSTDTAELIALQTKLLTMASHSVKHQGHLVYATCSWQVAENEAQISHFLAAHPQFVLVNQQMLGLPQQNSDTMFVAVLKKTVAE